MLSILPQALTRSLERLTGRLLAATLGATCFLCRAESAAGLICADCLADLPPLPGATCPQCGEETTHGERCGACLTEAPHFDRTTAAFTYEFPVDRIIQALKYGHRLAIAEWLGQRIASALPIRPDEIIPLPLHPERLRERGFNQSMEIARAIGKAQRLPVNFRSLARTRATPPQADLALKERRRNVRGAFECTADLRGRHVLLVDDVMTSGATASECARVLKLHGASEVSVAVAARALKQRSML